MGLYAQIGIQRQHGFGPGRLQTWVAPVDDIFTVVCSLSLLGQRTQHGQGVRDDTGAHSMF